MLSLPISLVFITTLSVSHSNGIHTDTTTEQDTVLTVDALTRMNAFWKRFTKEPSSIRDSARHENQIVIPFHTDTAQHTMYVKYQEVNIPALAAQYPSVAEDLQSTGLTVPQWQRLKQALGAAVVADEYQRQDQLALDSVFHAHVPIPVVVYSTTITRNIEFLRAHHKDADSLSASLDFPVVKVEKVDAVFNGNGLQLKF